MTEPTSSATVTPKGSSTNAFGFSQLSGRIGSMQKSFVAMTNNTSSAIKKEVDNNGEQQQQGDAPTMTMTIPPQELTETQKLQLTVKQAQSQHVETVHVYQQTLQELQTAMNEFQQSQKATQDQLEQVANELQETTQQLQSEETSKFQQASQTLTEDLKWRLEELSKPTNLEAYEQQLTELEQNYEKEIEQLEQQYTVRMDKIKVVSEKKLQEKFTEIQRKEQTLVETHVTTMNDQLEGNLAQIEKGLQEKIDKGCNELLMKLQQPQEQSGGDQEGDIRNTPEFQQANKPLVQQVAEQQQQQQQQQETEQPQEEATDKNANNDSANKAKEEEHEF